MSGKLPVILTAVLLAAALLVACAQKTTALPAEPGIISESFDAPEAVPNEEKAPLYGANIEPNDMEMFNQNDTQIMGAYLDMTPQQIDALFGEALSETAYHNDGEWGQNVYMVQYEYAYVLFEPTGAEPMETRGEDYVVDNDKYNGQYFVTGIYINSNEYDIGPRGINVGCNIQEVLNAFKADVLSEADAYNFVELYNHIDELGNQYKGHLELDSTKEIVSVRYSLYSSGKLSDLIYTIENDTVTSIVLCSGRYQPWYLNEIS